MKIMKRDKNRTEDALSLMTHRQLVAKRFRRHKLAISALICLIILYVVCFASGFFAPYSSAKHFTNNASMPPQAIHLFDKSGKFIGPFVYGFSTERDPKTFEKIYTIDPEQVFRIRFFTHAEPYKLFGLIQSDIHLFGTDEGTICLMGSDIMGRDMFSRILHGGQLSLSIGLVGVFLSLLLGLLLGGVAGYYGGRIDSFIMRIVDLFMSLPTIPLWMGLAAAVPRNWTTQQTYFAITIILSFFGWTNIARVVRGRFLSLREEDFVLASRLTGASDARIITSHMIPSFVSYIIISLTLSIPRMIIGETTLSFLGLGLQAPAVSWGVLLSDAQSFRAIALTPWLLIPGIFVVVTSLAFNFVGDGLRDAADPQGN